MSAIDNLWNLVSSFANKNAEHYLMVDIPRERTDFTGSDAPLAPMKSYMRLWLTDMYLAKARNWFVNQYPAVHTSVALKYGPDAIKISHVTNGSDQLGRGVLKDYALTDLMPFSGGTVELQCGLIALKGTNLLKESIGILKDFSGLVAAPIGHTLDIAEKVSSGLQNLLTGGNGQVALALHKQYASAGGGGGNIELKPGYLALIAATDRDIDAKQLSVANSQLLFKGKALEGYDYILLRIEGRPERDNWRMPNIEEPLNAAIRETLQGNADKAKEYKTAALLVVYQSPDLAVGDRRRVANAIEAELKDIAEGHQAVGGDVPTLADIMKARAMPIDKALQQPPLSYAEIVGS